LEVGAGWGRRGYGIFLFSVKILRKKSIHTVFHKSLYQE
jgi:hypothetical protein